MSRLIKILFLCFLFTACNDYQKALKSEETKVKYDLAEKYYNNGEFRRAKNLFEQLVPKYRGRPQAERVVYFYAKALVETKDYILAAYQFESFVKAYPKSQKLEEAYFLIGYCYYEESPVFSLEQSQTHEGLNKIQEFINRYPDSERMAEANNMVQELRIKIEKKQFEIAKQYKTIRDYKSAIKAVDNFIGDNPGTPFREEALFVQLESAGILALNSVYNKKKKRLESAKAFISAFKVKYPESKFNNKVDNLLTELDAEITTFVSN